MNYLTNIFFCEDCKRDFSQEKSLEQHNRDRHGSIKSAHEENTAETKSVRKSELKAENNMILLAIVAFVILSLEK